VEASLVTAYSPYLQPLKADHSNVSLLLLFVSDFSNTTITPANFQQKGGRKGKYFVFYQLSDLSNWISARLLCFKPHLV